MARAASTLTVMLIPGLLLVVSDVNECEEGPAHGPCSQHANCSNTHGGYQCTCRDGYQGDGNNCTGKTTTMKTKKNVYFWVQKMK